MNTNAVRATANAAVRPDTMRKTALAAGLLYLLTFFSIPRLALFGPLLDNPNYILGSGDVTGVFVGIVLELIVAFAIVGTGVALFPVLKRQNEGVALGFVTARLFETGIIVVGIISVLSIVTLRQDVGATAGADAASLVLTGRSLIAIHDWTFLLIEMGMLDADTTIGWYVMRIGGLFFWAALATGGYFAWYGRRT